MDIKRVTKAVTFGAIPTIIAALLMFDVLAISKGGSEASISSLIIKSSYEMPFAVFMVGQFSGILIGHLFWRMKTNNDTKEIDSRNISDSKNQ